MSPHRTRLWIGPITVSACKVRRASRFAFFGCPGKIFFVFVLCAVPIPFGFNGFEIGGLPDVWSPHFRGYLSRPHAFDRASCSKVMLQSHAPTGHQRFRTFVASVSSTYGGLDNKKWMKSR